MITATPKDTVLCHLEQFDAVGAVLRFDRRDRLAAILTDVDVAILNHRAASGIGPNRLKALAADCIFSRPGAGLRQPSARGPIPQMRGKISGRHGPPRFNAMSTNWMPPSGTGLSMPNPDGKLRLSCVQEISQGLRDLLAARSLAPAHKTPSSPLGLIEEERLIERGALSDISAGCVRSRIAAKRAQLAFRFPGALIIAASRRQCQLPISILKHPAGKPIGDDQFEVVAGMTPENYFAAVIRETIGNERRQIGITPSDPHARLTGPN